MLRLLVVSMQSEQLKERTLAFALSALRLVDKIPRRDPIEVIGRQLARSATSIGANYRATCNGRSRAEFIARLGVVVEESDETVYWLELLNRMEPGLSRHVVLVLNEAIELRAIFARSLGTARANTNRAQPDDK